MRIRGLASAAVIAAAVTGGAAQTGRAPVLSGVKVLDVKPAAAEVYVQFVVIDADGDFDPANASAVDLGLFCGEGGFASNTFGPVAHTAGNVRYFRARSAAHTGRGSCDLSLTVKDTAGNPSNVHRTTVVFPGETAAADTREKAPASIPGTLAPVSNGTHDLVVTRVRRGRSFDGGMTQTRREDDVFLTVDLRTADPCFSLESAATCFEPPVAGLAKIEKACGAVQDETGKAYPSDGGGLMGGTTFCNFVVPKSVGAVTLKLTGYPDIRLPVR